MRPGLSGMAQVACITTTTISLFGTRKSVSEACLPIEYLENVTFGML